jgi:hypothetical protein
MAAVPREQAKKLFPPPVCPSTKIFKWTHTGKYCFGRTLYQTFQEMNHLAKENMLETIFSPSENEHQLDRTTRDFSV